MSRNSHLLAVLHRTNPVPEPDSLADSDAAKELAMKRPGSIVDWRVRGDEYLGDGYRIRLVEPRRWEVTYRGKPLAQHPSLRTAFSTVEHHRRETLRRHDLFRHAGVFLLAVVGWSVAVRYGDRGNRGWLLLLCGIAYVALSAFIRFSAAFSRNIDDPYRRPLPWERRPWWRRLLGR